MSAPPLLFEPVLNAPGLWRELGKTHGLSEKDFKWLGHVQLATQALRSQQTPPMVAHRILLGSRTLSSVPLAGSFVLSVPPDARGILFYTPFDGLKKYASPQALHDHLKTYLASADEEDRLLAFLAIAQRRQLVEEQEISVSFEVISGDIFDDQKAAIEQAQRIDAQAMIDELKHLPKLEALLENIVSQPSPSEHPGVNQARSRITFYPPPKSAIARLSGKLLTLLFAHMELFWDSPSKNGTSRRLFFSHAIAAQAHADLLLKREAGIIDAEKFDNLLAWFDSKNGTGRRATLENVRLWEHQGSFVELAGSLMISHTDACLYTPSQGLQVLKDYPDLKETLLSKFSAAGHEDELYGLLSLEERQRFIGFDQPHVSGEALGGDVFKVLFEGILTKQRQNIEYALQVFRHSDGEVDIAALFDKALDIRSMIHDRLLTLNADGRWSTRPVFSGRQLPSMVKADTAATEVKKFTSILSLIAAQFAGQPFATHTAQRDWLDTMKPQLAHALFAGITGEARLLVMNGTLRRSEQAIVDTVLNPERPSRGDRKGLNGFRPDAFSLCVQSARDEKPLPLAYCVLITERGGLDVRHSGRALLWTPALGLEVFDSIVRCREALNRRLLDPEQRLTLLENLTPSDHRYHQHYTLGDLRPITGSVLEDRTQSAIERFLDRCERLRQADAPASVKDRALKAMTQEPIDANLKRATVLAESLGKLPLIPAWLETASLDGQQFHLELLEQWRHSVSSAGDYLQGLPTLRDHIHQTLTTLLGNRFALHDPDPDSITITPELALAGPARSLTDFALDLSHIAQTTAFMVSSATGSELPAGLDQQAVRSLLLSLDISSTFSKRITALLSASDAPAQARRLRFFRQLPWQLLQHAHQLQLQEHISAPAFDLISQIFDMPDAVARAGLEGTSAIIRPLELIKTAGAVPVKALGMYLLGPAAGKPGPQVLYTPYHGEQAFHEFENDAAIVTALNVPGLLQDLLIRRLPQAQQTVFRSLFNESVGKLCEMTLATTPETGNSLHRFFSDNVKLLASLLGSHAKPSAQTDWDMAKKMFSAGINRLSGVLPGKLAYPQFLWESFKDFEASAEAQQNRHWAKALKDFIAGAAQMISLGRAHLESTLDSTLEATAVEARQGAGGAPRWETTLTVSADRTTLQMHEAPTIALKDLHPNALAGTYDDPSTEARYAAVAGKVYPVTHSQTGRQIKDGPPLQLTPARRLMIDPDRDAIHFGKTLSTLRNRVVHEREARRWLNIEAQGMEQIRRLHPQKARALTHAIDLARYYAFNSLHNLVQLNNYAPGTRLETFLKQFFDTKRVDADLLAKIKKTIVPICNALVDPTDDLMNTERFVIGTSRYRYTNLAAFVLDDDARRCLHFTERFFNPGLDWYKAFLTEPFDVDTHAQASTLIHELSHQLVGAVDINYLEARRPFSDLIATITGVGVAVKAAQTDFQREALSLATPAQELFARWNNHSQKWVNLGEASGTDHLARKILQVTLSPTLEDARNAFLSPNDPTARIDTILHNADSIAFLICEMGRQLDPVTSSIGILN